jgi:hypothetical protein
MIEGDARDGFSWHFGQPWLVSYSSPVPPLPSFGFTLAATGTTLSISMFSSAE